MGLVPALLYVDITSLVLLTIIVMIMVEGEQTPFAITSGVVKRFSFTSWECAHFAACVQMCYIVTFRWDNAHILNSSDHLVLRVGSSDLDTPDGS